VTCLSPRQTETLNFVAGFIARRGHAPTLREVADGVGLGAPTSAREVVMQLEDRGQLRRLPGKARGLEVIEKAGKPGEILLYRNLDSFLIAKIDLVRAAHFTCFPWRFDQLCWAKSRVRVKRATVAAIMPEGSDPTLLGETIQALKNQRDARRMRADQDFHQAVAKAALSRRES
jgi:SOS-response transcriptional repressor LexA